MTTTETHADEANADPHAPSAPVVTDWPEHPDRFDLAGLGAAYLQHAILGLATVINTDSRPTHTPAQFNVNFAHARLVDTDTITNLLDNLEDHELRVVVDSMLATARRELLIGIRNVLQRQPDVEPPCDDTDCWLDGLTPEHKDEFLVHVATLRAENAATDPWATSDPTLEPAHPTPSTGEATPS